MGPEIKSSAERARQRVNQDSRAWNIALWRIATGKPGPGGVARELSTVTGLSEECIRSRVRQASREYPPDPIVLGANMTPDDLDYRAAIFQHSEAAVTRDFLGGINGVQRKTPDTEDARVKRQRVAGKLISLSMDPRGT